MIKKGVIEALLFPGQGAQKPGMGRDIYETYSVAKAVFDRANMLLDIDIKALCFDGSEEDLRKTENTQPALFTVSMALWELLREKGLRGEYAAGHSLGEISAIVGAGYLSFDDGLRIVRERGKIMAAADPEGNGAMSAILGLAPENVASLCEKATTGVVVPANYNSPDQVVISGEREAVAEVEALSKEAGAKRIVALNVSGAFHSPLMADASDEFAQLLASYEFHQTPVSVLSNVSAQPHTPETIVENLAKQLFSPVRWVACAEWLHAKDVNRYVEVGPNAILTGLMKKITGETNTLSVYSRESYRKAVKELSGIEVR